MFFSHKKSIPIHPTFYPEAIIENITPKKYLQNRIIQHEVNLNDFAELSWTNTSLPVEDGKYLYVLSLDDKLYLAPKDGAVRNHSWLSNGNPVKGAGNLVVKNNQIFIFDNNSGHYKPSKEALLRTGAIQFFYDLDNTADIKFIDYSKINYDLITTYKIMQDENNNIALEKTDAASSGRDSDRFTGSPKQFRSFLLGYNWSKQNNKIPTDGGDAESLSNIKNNYDVCPTLEKY